MEADKQILTHQVQNGIRQLYDKYAGMLLGYVFEIVKDPKQAEQHLIDIYNNIPPYINHLSKDGTITWCQLQLFAKSHLSGVFATGGNGVAVSGLNDYGTRNKFLDLMTAEQKQVFCYVYYHNKTTAQLAGELNRTEDSIRQALKQALAIIRKGS